MHSTAKTRKVYTAPISAYHCVNFYGLMLWKRCVKTVHGSVQKPGLAHNMYALISSLPAVSTVGHNSSPSLPTVLHTTFSTQNSTVLYLLARYLSTLPTGPITKTTIYI